MVRSRAAVRSLWELDRSDRVAAAVILTVTTVMTAATQVVVPLWRWVTGRGIVVDYVGPVDAPRLDVAGVAHDAEGTVRAVVPGPSASLRLLDLAPGVLVTVLVAVGCWMLWRTTADIVGGEAFGTRTVVRLRVLGVLVALGVPVLGVLRGVADLQVVASLDLPELTGVIDVRWEALVAGFLVLVVAEAFRAGARMREDLEGLV